MPVKILETHVSMGISRGGGSKAMQSKKRLMVTQKQVLPTIISRRRYPKRSKTFNIQVRIQHEKLEHPPGVNHVGEYRGLLPRA